MKNLKMKTINVMVVALLIVTTSVFSQTKPTEQLINVPEETLCISPEDLEAKSMALIKTEMIKRKLKIKEEAITAVSETKALLQLIEAGEKDKAIEEGNRLIGKFKVLLLREPSANKILVDVQSKKNMLISDIETVKSLVDAAKEKISKRHYQDAAALLNKVKSEVVIQNIFIPTGTYPESIKVATALLKEGNEEDAKKVLQKVLGTLLIEKTILPIPILKAEEAIVAATVLDIKTDDYKGKVVNLLNFADYQLHLAEEMGYGKKDKDYEMLYKLMHKTKDSVTKGIDSKAGLKKSSRQLRKFRERLFPEKLNK